MGHIRTRAETGKLYLDFTYQNQRCREQTALPDTPENRKKLGKILDRIEAEILLGQFEYRKQFPDSRLLPKLEQQQKIRVQRINGTPCFVDFANTWFDEMSAGWRLSYQNKIRRLLDNRLIPYFNTKDVGQITKADLLQFRAQLTKVTRKNGNPISADHINRHMKILRMIFNEAADRYDFTTPYRNIKQLKIQRADIEPFTLDEVNLFLKSIRIDFNAYYTVRFFTGMRTGEIDGLKWHYVDFEKRQILIRECWLDNRVEYTKTDGSQREIQMSQPVYDALLRQFNITGKEHEYVFVNRAGNPLDHNNVNKRIWQPMLRFLGLKPRSPYQTRHTAATLWLASGESPEWIANQMGHANTEMLFRVYSRFVPNLTRRDGSAFEKLIGSVLKENSHVSI